ncbi:hypothetical protein [Pseudomonas quasicaspiana]|uniref:hypothetical protein n=1 Tax=Pseudomonas quasicaspiana TaxID=2829821 RepID=UPI001E4D906A|nr:hypothetical protein [Pseudomonas quasicaspiana]MCD5973251.1 hypothetical protein [Pseudomonas quasicaspiana]
MQLEYKETGHCAGFFVGEYRPTHYPTFISFSLPLPPHTRQFKPHRHGLQVRMLAIPADASKGRGMFDQLN